LSVASVVVRTTWILLLCGVLTAVGIVRRPPLLVTLYAVAVTAASLYMELTDLAWKPEDGASFAGVYLILLSLPMSMAPLDLPQRFFDNQPIALTEGVLILAAYVQVATFWAVWELAKAAWPRDGARPGDALERRRWKV
jgi:hypothetical protein